MVEDEFLEILNHEFKLDKSKSQLLIVISPLKTLQEAKSVIETSGVRVIETKYLSSDRVLLKLDVMDIRKIVLRLIEHGFEIAKGINALPTKIYGERLK